ncbi:TIGR04283 family arsenosugar biosynthesis glycosyltransferase [Lewinella sp. IMCC34183]|uniref:TIGR04283 family arsenosugar biosynthesis glycosyltransferase n=1 Tax=Lewinella sp. IMCC34183 TaxID=2248762 RepID=UPI0018E51399|nr:TIGR04283 family arsenosugar biosynthesis glycosyltransferase [Lewinella sp. IMCC34183]
MIIPTWNEAATLATTLRHLTATAVPDADLELIVADGGSSDETRDIARRCGAKVIPCTRGRAPQMNAGARAARGEFLYFLHADTLPPADWYARLTADPHGLPACFRLRFGGQERLPWLRVYSYFTRFDIDAFRFGDQSLWVRRADFRAVGGYPDDWQLLEDNYLVRRLRRHRGGFRIVAASVTTSPRKYLRHGFVYTQLVYTLLYTLYRLGAGQPRLARLYRRLLQ